MTQEIDDLRKNLEDCIGNLGYVGAQFVAKMTERSVIDDRDNPYDECLELERKLAKLNGDPYAVPYDWPVRWDIGAPLPIVLSGEGKVFLIYFVSVVNSNYDPLRVKFLEGTYPENSQMAFNEKWLALVEFRNCFVYKFGEPSDETIYRHELWGKGLCFYDAHLVENSRWLHELVGGDEDLLLSDRHRRTKHLIFAFHDDLFECLVNDTYTELYKLSHTEVLEIARNKIW
jgi:hypothetical protein